MRRLLIPVLIFLSLPAVSQTDTSQLLRAFPITSYMVNLNDSVKVVQVLLPDGPVLKEKQLGVLRGVYSSSHADTVQKGYGRCNLIKGDYYYFSIGHNPSGTSPKEGDLIYTFVAKPNVYNGQMIKIASHFIELQNVYDVPLYDRYTVFLNWTEIMEKNLVDSMVKDIQFTGGYFIQNNPSMNQLITSGKFKDKKVLNVMTECQASYIKNFLDYMIARPRLYAGKSWKISEIFATWLTSGAPTLVNSQW